MNKNAMWPDTQSFIAIMLVMSMVGLTFALVFVEIPKDSDVLKIMIGAMMTVGFASIIGFYFGSSTGSKDKDETQAKIVASLTGTSGPAGGNGAVARLAAEKAALPAAAAVAPLAAAVAAPPAVDRELDERGLTGAAPKGHGG